ncbi:exonuclease domain-containing protein [Hymenobacter psychrotolerans]|uniref:DNA polymerase-3 subunit epsilon n=1 Tax=Hymenobacter psychrotolerans DSM 18569 TaxID=1121959 RepID=A0A1M7GDG5_9BACT|nr:exonuclease domain-containing protein [Hymenobacter psychrotolerans]SHM14216.1 DNA polymerase-3 subunit epsilon [Hymenobacter psychrotolerans DSM 18569]
MYAIIDLETTGGQPAQDRITEIAIFIHDGEKVVDQFDTLINPGRSIPFFITQLTGINDEMVRDAPKFHEVARKVVEMTEGCVFVAHNVRFDYSFLKKEFGDLGYNYSRKTLCTVRLSRSLMPGQPSYSLGKLCQNIGIPLQGRHRAAGDAAATAILFDRLLKISQQEEALTKPGLSPADTLAAVDANAPAGRRPVPQATAGAVATKQPSARKVKAVQEAIRTALLPPNITPEKVASLPHEAGVYYFHDEQGEVIYVGKSINIYKRIQQHFAVDYKSRKSIEFKNSISDITWELTGSELVALLYESHEIKRLKPLYNRKLRRSVFPAGIFLRTDEQGYKHLYYGRADDHAESHPLIALGNQFKAKGFLFHKVSKFNLCQKLCDLYKTQGACFDYQVHRCKGACLGLEPPEEYNKRVEEAIESFTYEHGTFVVLGQGRRADEKTVVLVENGRYMGFGYVDTESFSARRLADFRDVITRYNDNKDAQQIIRQYLRTKHKDKVKVFNQ